MAVGRPCGHGMDGMGGCVALDRLDGEDGCGWCVCVCVSAGGGGRGEGQKHLAGVGRVEALDQLDRRRLAAPRRADERDLLPRQRREGEAVEDLLLRLPREGEVNEGDGRGLQHQAGRQRGRSTCGSDGKVKSTSTKSMRPATRGGASLGGAFGIGSMRLFLGVQARADEASRCRLRVGSSGSVSRRSDASPKRRTARS